MRRHYKSEHWAPCCNQTLLWYDWKIVESDVKPEKTTTTSGLWVWPDIWPQNKCRSLWPIIHGPVILPYILKTDVWTSNFGIMNQYDQRFDLKISVGHVTYILWSWFCLVSWRLFDVWTSLFGIMNPYGLTFDLKMNIGLWELYFMLQWFCFISRRLFDVWTSYFGVELGLVHPLSG